VDPVHYSPWVPRWSAGPTVIRRLHSMGPYMLVLKKAHANEMMRCILHGSGQSSACCLRERAKFSGAPSTTKIDANSCVFKIKLHARTHAFAVLLLLEFEKTTRTGRMDVSSSGRTHLDLDRSTIAYTAQARARTDRRPPRTKSCR
jgi:hypothetical protein